MIPESPRPADPAVPGEELVPAGSELALGWPGPAIPYDGAPSVVQRATLRDGAHQDRLERHGHVVVPFVDEATLGRLLAICRELGPSPGDPGTGYFVGNSGTSVDWKRSVGEAVLPLVESALAELFDDHHAFYRTFITKWPGTDGDLPAHQDPTMVADEERFRGVTLWCPLVPMTSAAGDDRGVLRVVPGSHRLPSSRWYRSRWYAGSVLDDVQDDIYRRYSVPVHTAPGEAIVFDHRTAHFSLANASDGPRFVLALALRPRETGNVNIECDADGWVSCYPVDEEYYLLDPPEGTLDIEPLWRRRRIAPPRVTVADLAGLQAELGFAAVPARPEPEPESNPSPNPNPEPGRPGRDRRWWRPRGR